MYVCGDDEKTCNSSRRQRPTYTRLRAYLDSLPTLHPWNAPSDSHVSSPNDRSVRSVWKLFFHIVFRVDKEAGRR